MDIMLLKRILLWEIKAFLMLWIINAVLFVIFSFAISNFQVSTYALFSKLTFAETGIILIVAGLIAFSGSVSANKSKEYLSKSEQNWTIDKLRAREKQANKYIVLAALFFLQSIIISFVGY